MFFVFSVNPYHGHFHPLCPLARALRRRGHRVAFATWSGFADVVVEAGFQVLEAGASPYASWVWAEDIIQRKALDIVIAASRDRPDVIIREVTDFGAVLAAEKLNVPHLTLGAGLFIPDAWWHGLLDGGLERVRAQLNLPPDPLLTRLYPHGYLDVTPVWFQQFSGPRPPTHRFVAEGGAPEGLGRPPDWLQELPSDRPLVYVTFGTVYNRRPRMLALIVRAVAELGLPTVCTVGNDLDPSMLFPDGAPPGVVIAAYVPQTHVLRRSAVIVTHGGFNTLMGALRHGVLPLVLPLGSDHQVNAQRCVDLGIGVSMGTSELTGSAIAGVVAELIDDEQRRARLHRLRSTAPRPVSLAATAAAVEALGSEPDALNDRTAG